MLGDTPLAATPLSALGGGVVYTRYVGAAGQVTGEARAAATFVSAAVADGYAASSVLVAPSVFNATSIATATGTALPASLTNVFSTLTEPLLTAEEVATYAVFTSNVEALGRSTALVSSLAELNSEVVEHSFGTAVFVGGLVYFANLLASATGTDRGTALQGFLTAVSETSGGTAQVSALQDHAVSVIATAVGEAFPSTLVDFSAEVVATATGEALVLAYAVFISVASAGVLGVDEVTRRLLWEVIDDAQLANWQNISNAESAGWGVVSDAQTTTWSPVKTQT